MGNTIIRSLKQYDQEKEKQIRPRSGRRDFLKIGMWKTYMFTSIIAFFIALDVQILYGWLSHLLPDKQWKKELEAAYKENRVIRAELVRTELIEEKNNGHRKPNQYYKCSYRYWVDDCYYKCDVLTDDNPRRTLSILYEKEHPEISTSIYGNESWRYRNAPKWWQYILYFFLMFGIMYLILRYTMPFHIE